jgi:hypothetical protein
MISKTLLKTKPSEPVSLIPPSLTLIQIAELHHASSTVSEYITIEDISDSIKVYDLETAQQLTYQGVAVGPNSFADQRDQPDQECPPPKYFDPAML